MNALDKLRRNSPLSTVARRVSERREQLHRAYIERELERVAELDADTETPPHDRVALAGKTPQYDAWHDVATISSHVSRINDESARNKLNAIERRAVLDACEMMLRDPNDVDSSDVNLGALATAVAKLRRWRG